MSHDTLPGLVLSDLAGVATQQVQVSPELAALWLGRNQHNRTLSAAAIKKYAADMTAGAWRFTGQPIVFDALGHLIDGQHRLTAQIRASVTLNWLVITGVPTETRDYIDIGRPRTVANQLQIKGFRDGHGTGAVARLDLIYRGTGSPSKPAIREHAEANADIFCRGAHIGRGIAQTIRGSMAAYGLAYAYLTRIDAEVAEEFFAALLTGAGLPITSPILVARNHISRSRTSNSLTEAQRVAFVNYLFRCWNLWVTGKRVKSFAIPADRVEPLTPLEVAS